MLQLLSQFYRNKSTGMSRKSFKKRNTSFFHSDTPLVSKRVRIILSSPKDADKLAGAIREQRRGSTHTSFKVSDKVERKLAEAD